MVEFIRAGRLMMLAIKRPVVLYPSKVGAVEFLCHIKQDDITNDQMLLTGCVHICCFSSHITPEPPVFTVKPESHDTAPGSNVVLKSAFTGSAPLVVKWFREEKELFTGGRCFIKKDASSSSLEVNSVKPSDSATYTCQVSNDAGKVDCTAVLFVKGAVSLSFFKSKEKAALFFL